MLDGKKILIVEDDAIVYKKLQMTLKSHGVITYPYVPNVDDAISIIKGDKPDLVLIDIELQGKKRGTDLGFMLSSKYKVPFIYVTNFSDKDTFDLALDTQHEQFLVKKYIEEINILETKPVLDSSLLLMNVKTVLNKFEKTEKRSKDALLLKTHYASKVRETALDEVVEVPILFNEISYVTTNAISNPQKPNMLEKLKSNYIRFETVNKESYYLSASLKMINNILPNSFVRISEDYIINLYSKGFLGKINESHIKIDDKIFKISSNYKNTFNLKLKEIFE